MHVHFLLPSIFAWFLDIAANPAPLEISSIWARAPALEDTESLVAYVEEKLHGITLHIPAASAKINQFIETMTSVVVVSKNFRYEIEHSTQENITAEEVSGKLSVELALFVQNFDTVFFLPLPDDHEARTEERVKIIDWLMVEVEDILVRILPVPEADVRERCQEVELHVKDVLLITGRQYFA